MDKSIVDPCTSPQKSTAVVKKEMVQVTFVGVRVDEKMELTNAVRRMLGEPRGWSNSNHKR